MQETWDMGSIPGSGRSLGEGNGNSLQYSCLESLMDKGAWQQQSIGLHRVGHDWHMHSEGSMTSNRLNTKMDNRRIMVKMLRAKDKEEIVKAAREKWLITYLQGNPNKIKSWLLNRNNWGQKVLSHSKFSKKNQPTIPCLSMGYLKNKGKMKTFPDK